MSALMVFFVVLTCLAVGLTTFFAMFLFVGKDKICMESSESQAKNFAKRKHLVFCILVAVAAALAVFAAFFSVLLFGNLAEKVADKTQTLMIFLTPFVLAVAVLLTAAARLYPSLKAAYENENKLTKNAENNALFSTKGIVRMAVFTALSVVLYLFVKFPLPFIFPSFLDIQISDMPALLATFTMGRGAGAIIIILKTLIKLPMTGTGGVGELGDLILGLTYVFVSGTVYKKIRTKKGAILSLVLGSLATTAAAIIVNRVILIPFYTSYMFPWEALLGMVRPLYPSVTRSSFYGFYLWLAVLPFNLLRCIITSLVTFFLYKPVKLIFKQRPKSEK